jgi:class 3 adenylate cyclase
VWTEDIVEDIENELERAGVLRRPERVPAMSFLDLVDYTRLTEERGDAAAAALAETLAVLVDRSSREHGGVPVKWLGDGVMVHFREPAEAVARNGDRRGQERMPWVWSTYDARRVGRCRG